LEEVMATQVNVQPGHGKAGRQPTRQFLDSLSGHDDPGMFGRMFPNLEPLAVDDGPLKELADAMKDANPGDAAGNNTKVPAGFTYLGQFVDHDITLDLTSLGDKEADPIAVEYTGARSRQCLRSRSRRQPAALRAQSRRCRWQDARPETPDRQDHQR
jgi:hypothetical protein